LVSQASALRRRPPHSLRSDRWTERGDGAHRQRCFEGVARVRFSGVQCGQCPFRRTSAPGWLGSYNAGSVFASIWEGFPFFCHTKINYEAKGCIERAMKRGPLCTGGLAFANSIAAPASLYGAVNEARERVRLVVVECMSPSEFGEHHKDWR